jgi:hypothetical protein
MTSRFLTTTWMVYLLIQISALGNEFSYIISKVVIPSRIEILVRIEGCQGPGTRPGARREVETSPIRLRLHWARSYFTCGVANVWQTSSSTVRNIVEHLPLAPWFDMGIIRGFQQPEPWRSLITKLQTIYSQKPWFSLLDIPRSRTDPISHGDSSTPWPNPCPYPLRSGLRQAKNVERISYKKNTSVEPETADKMFFPSGVSSTRSRLYRNSYTMQFSVECSRLDRMFYTKCISVEPNRLNKISFA